MNKRILVIGESCKDVFLYCSSDRLCPDRPVPVLKVLNKTHNGGMAKNVYENIKSIYKDCDILTNSNWSKITKTRYVHKQSNHTFFRVDSNETVDRVDLKAVDYSKYDCLVISDYDKGFLSESDIENISQNHSCVFLDTKKILGNWVNKVKFIKINNFEYERSKKFVENCADIKIIKTAGEDGCYYQNIRYPVKKVEVIDVSGAGDSFFAGLVVKYCQTNDIIESIKFANLCASTVVQERGVTTI
jgi:bifunctional ADP-heptose synthase (sugar kinase/adenylyltransferase)